LASHCVSFPRYTCAGNKGAAADRTSEYLNRFRFSSHHETLSGRLRDRVKHGKLPFTHAVLAEERSPSEKTPSALSDVLPFPDALLQPSCCAAAARDPGIRIEPAWRAAIVYGLPCAVNFLLPAAYYLAARFAGDFESTVLHALNGGGQNMSRA
jgi:hypothetical protein